MIYSSSSVDVSKQKTQCAVVFCQGDTLLPSAGEIDKACSGLLSALLKSKDLGAKEAEHVWLPLMPGSQNWERVLLIQLGKRPAKKSRQIAENSATKVLNKLAKLLNAAKFKDAAVFFDDLEVAGREDLTREREWLASTLVQKMSFHSYQFSLKQAKEKKQAGLKKLLINLSGANKAGLNKAIKQAAALGEGINYTRELGNLPANICTPVYLADQARDLAKQYSALSAKSLTEKQMEKLGMHSLLSVSRGSDEEARLIIMEYKGADTKQPHVLVGKGITFDTGGISLKPSPAMDEMKYDMCGAASVFGTIKALAEMEAKVHVVGIVAAAENMPSGRATKPGDVVTSMSGQTIEILNTDAEGRLVLCDALTYAERYKPRTLVDIATLTGAIIIALGHHASGLYANDQKLANALLEAGERANDRAWQMPLWDDYQKQLDSNFADMANIGGRTGGSITAASFLARFTKKHRWAHLDVAGSAFHGGTTSKGATGRPVGLLVDYLLNN